MSASLDDATAIERVQTSRCYVHAVLVLLDDPPALFDTVGRYDDRLVRADGAWRIAARTFRATRMIAGTG